jgi:hypothetical protein
MLIRRFKKKWVDHPLDKVGHRVSIFRYGKGFFSLGLYHSNHSFLLSGVSGRRILQTPSTLALIKNRLNEARGPNGILITSIPTCNPRAA